jgi:hypothetical protein
MKTRKSPIVVPYWCLQKINSGLAIPTVLMGGLNKEATALLAPPLDST